MSSQVFPYAIQYENSLGEVRTRIITLWPTQTRKGKEVIKFKDNWDHTWSTVLEMDADSKTDFWNYMGEAFALACMESFEDDVADNHPDSKGTHRFLNMIPKAQIVIPDCDYVPLITELLSEIKFKVIADFSRG